MVAAGGHDPRHRRKQGGEDVLGGGLADAAGDGHDRGRGAAPHGGREIAQRALGVVDHDARRAGPHGRRRARLDDDGDRAGAERGAGEVAAVERLAAQRHEQVAGRDRAAVDGDPGGDGLRGACLEAAAAGGRRLLERQGDHATPAPPSDTPARAAGSREAQHGELRGGDLAVVEVDRLGSQDLIGLVTLAGDHQGVAGRASRNARRMAARRSGSTTTRSRSPAAMPASTSAMMASGIFAARVVGGHARRDRRDRRRRRP